MKVTLKLLVTYRKFLPPEAKDGKMEVDVPPGTDAVSLVEQFGIPTDRSSVILVNGRTSKPGDNLGEGDVVFVFPAMAGG